MYVSLRGELEDGTVFIDTQKEEHDFILGQAQVAKGLEMAVVGMGVGEQAKLDIGEGYGYSSRRPELVPEDCKRLFMEVELFRYEKEKNLHQMQEEEKIDFCNKRREMGQVLFKDKKYQGALKQYQKALTCLGSDIGGMNGAMPGMGGSWSSKYEKKKK